MAESSARVLEFKLAMAGSKGEAVSLNISGHLSLDNLVPFRAESASLLDRMSPASLTVDLSGIDFIDSAAALALMDLKGDAEARNIPFSFVNAGKKTKGVIGLIDILKVSR